jgi:hypothetical protein
MAGPGCQTKVEEAPGLWSPLCLIHSVLLKDRRRSGWPCSRECPSFVHSTVTRLWAEPPGSRIEKQWPHEKPSSVTQVDYRQFCQTFWNNSVKRAPPPHPQSILLEAFLPALCDTGQFRAIFASLA